MTIRRPREERRNLNTEEMESMSYVDFVHNADEEGWPFPDSDAGGLLIDNKHQIESQLPWKH